MSVRTNLVSIVGVLGLVLVSVATSARADELDDLAGPEETEKPEAKPEAEKDVAPAPAPASDAAAAFGADAQGVDPEVMAKARGHFEQGVEFYSEGDYRAAMIELQRAYELHRTYKLLYNLGQVAYELRDYSGAERYFRDYLAKGGSELSPERRREIKSELARLRSRVATLRVTANQPDATFRVDDHVIVQPQAPVRVSAGRRTIRAEKAGFAPVERALDVTGGEELNVQLSFGVPLIAAGDAARSGGSKWPWVTGVMSGVFLVAAGAVGFAAYQDVAARDDALREYTTRSELDNLGAQAHTKALVADALLGAALVSAAATLVLALSGDSKPDTLTTTSVPGHARLPSAQFRF